MWRQNKAVKNWHPLLFELQAMQEIGPVSEIIYGQGRCKLQTLVLCFGQSTDCSVAAWKFLLGEVFVVGFRLLGNWQWLVGMVLVLVGRGWLGLGRWCWGRIGWWWVGVGTPVGGRPPSLPRLAGSLPRVQSGGVASQWSPDTGAAGSAHQPHHTNTTILSPLPRTAGTESGKGQTGWGEPRALVRLIGERTWWDVKGWDGQGQVVRGCEACATAHPLLLAVLPN